MLKNEVVYGAGKRHQVILENGMYSLVDTHYMNHVRASISASGWTIDAKVIFEKYCDKWNEGIYQDE